MSDYRAFLRRAIHSGDLVRALGGSGRNGSRRDLDGLMYDCKRALEVDRPVVTFHQVQFRLDLDTHTTRRVLDDLKVPHDVYVDARRLLTALKDQAAT